MRNPRLTFAIVLGIVAILAIAAGAYYLAVPAHSLPSFVPGHVSKGGKLPHKTRGYAGVALGVVLLVVSFVVAASGRRRRRWR